MPFNVATIGAAATLPPSSLHTYAAARKSKTILIAIGVSYTFTN